MAIDAPAPLQITIHPQPGNSSAGADSSQFWSNGAPSFKDVLDTINPLQHIPIISNIYQSLTGDIPSSGANLAGGALLGGPIGFVTALFNEIVKTSTGHDVGGNMIAALSDSPPTASDAAKNPASPSTLLAANEMPTYLSPNQRASYNAYVHTQNMLA